MHRLLVCIAITLMLSAAPAGAQELDWQRFEEAVAASGAEGKPLLVDVYAPWCGWCRKMKQDVYPSAAVQPLLAEHFVLTRLDYDDAETAYTYAGRRLSPSQLARHFGVQGVPAIVLLTPEGRPLLRLSGFVGAGDLREVLERAVAQPGGRP